MTKKLEKDALLSELAAVNAMLATISANDFIGKVGFESRKNEIEKTLATLSSTKDTLANVALFFHGIPVSGSRSIDAEFAAKALERYQDLVTKRMAVSETGGLGQRGPIPVRKASSLNISGVVHGSFGFILEEGGQDAPQLINSSLKEAVEGITDILNKFASDNDEDFAVTLSELDIRLFTSVKNFFATLHDDSATIRIVEGERDLKFGPEAVDRAFLRSQEVSLDEQPLIVIGTLIGVVPYGRRFELKTESGDVITGKVGPMFSREYLTRIEKDEHVIGRQWKASLTKKTVDRVGQQTKISYTLLELKDI